jgi:dipeptidyl aminopeptidase/acylaminoacyl peptidase
LEASIKQWGKKMQDEITDGVKYLKKEGITATEFIAIYSGSYLGYATLVGVVFTSGFNAFVVDNVGISNLFTFLKTILHY